MLPVMTNLYQKLTLGIVSAVILGADKSLIDFMTERTEIVHVFDTKVFAMDRIYETNDQWQAFHYKEVSSAIDQMNYRADMYDIAIIGGLPSHRVPFANELFIKEIPIIILLDEHEAFKFGYNELASRNYTKKVWVNERTGESSRMYYRDIIGEMEPIGF